MAFNFRVPSLKYMNMVRSIGVVALDEESPARDAMLSSWSVPLFGHFLIEIVYLFDVSHHNQHINYGFGAHVGDGCTTDVMDGYNLLAENCGDSIGFHLE